MLKTLGQVGGIMLDTNLAINVNRLEGALGKIKSGGPHAFIDTPYGDEKGRPANWRPEIRLKTEYEMGDVGGVITSSAGVSKQVAGFHGFLDGEEDWEV